MLKINFQLFWEISGLQICQFVSMGLICLILVLYLCFSISTEIRFQKSRIVSVTDELKLVGIRILSCVQQESSGYFFATVRHVINGSVGRIVERIAIFETTQIRVAIHVSCKYRRTK